MTYQQKIIVAKLLEGCTIAASGPGKIRLRDAAGNPIMKVSGATFYWLDRYLLRKHRGLFLINKTKVRSFHGNSFVNRLYKGKATAPGARPFCTGKKPSGSSNALTLF